MKRKVRGKDLQEVCFFYFGKEWPISFLIERKVANATLVPPATDLRILFHRPTFNLVHRCSTRPSFRRHFSTWISFCRYSFLQLNHINWKKKEVNKLNIGHSLNWINTWNEIHTLSFLLLYDSIRRINCSCALCNSLIGSARLLNISVSNQLYYEPNSVLRSILTWSFTWNY